MQKVLTSLFMLASLTISISYADKPPQGMMKNIDNLAMLGAALNNCFESREYKALSPEKSMKVLATSSNLSQLVERIGNYYRDDNLLSAYEVATVGYMNSNSVKKQVVSQYGKVCALEFLDSAEKKYQEANTSISSFIQQNPRK